MCLVIDQHIHDKKLKNSDSTKFLVAKSDIVCYKRLDPRISDPHSYTTPYQDVIVDFSHGVGEIRSSKYGWYVPFSISFADCHWNIHEGVHSYVEFYDIYSSLGGQFMFTAVIPKGSKYYFGRWGDIVSEKLIIFENSTAFYNYIRGRRMVTAKWLYSNLILDKEDRDSVFFMSIKNIFKNKSDLVYWVDSRR